MIFYSGNVFITAGLRETKLYLNTYSDSFSEYLLMSYGQSTEKHRFKDGSCSNKHYFKTFEEKTTVCVWGFLSDAAGVVKEKRHYH